MNRVRRLNKAQIEARELDFVALSDDLKRHFPSLSDERIATMAAMNATVAMIGADSLVTHLLDASAITLQAEASVSGLSETE